LIAIYAVPNLSGERDIPIIPDPKHGSEMEIQELSAPPLQRDN
jgi:hypothetical protein